MIYKQPSPPAHILQKCGWENGFCGPENLCTSNMTGQSVGLLTPSVVWILVSSYLLYKSGNFFSEDHSFVFGVKILYNLD